MTFADPYLLYFAAGMALIAVPIVLALVFVPAPYGRHGRSGMGPLVPARFGWILMESPSAALFLAIYAQGQHAGETVPRMLCALWSTHYIYRAFIYPFRLNGRPMPLSIAMSGFSFNLVNAWINARWTSHLGDYPTTWLTNPRFVVGALIFGLGWGINYHADAVLRGLRSGGKSGYQVPYGGLYRWISCPNYFGEIVEWGGWALATWSAPGAAFFVFTIANLAPRATAHHTWYRATFADYPPERKALVPGLL